MTDGPDSSEAPQEAADRLARSMTGREETAVVALLADADRARDSWRGAAALADASAGRRRTLLVNLSGPGSGLDDFLGLGDRDGLEAVRRGERKLSETAAQPADRSFLCLPSGREREGDASLGPTEDPELLRALERLAEKIREAGGMLLLYLEAGQLPPRLAEDLVDGAVLLGGAESGLPEAIPVIGRLAGEGSGGAPAGAGAPEDEPAGLEPSGRDGPPSGEDDSFLPGVPDEETAPDGPRDEEPGEGTGAVGSEPGELADEAAGGPPEDGPVAEEEAEEEGGEEAAADGSEPGEPADEADASPPEDAAPSDEEASGEEWHRHRDDPSADEEPAGVDAAGGGAGEGASDGELPGDGESSGRWRKHRRSSGVPWGKIAAGAAVVLLLAGGWWYLADRSLPGGEVVAGLTGSGSGAPSPADSAAADSVQRPARTAAGSGGPAASEPEAASEAEGASPEAAAPAGAGEPSTDAPEATAGDQGEADEAGAEEPVGTAIELPHSVLVASYASWPRARDRAEELRAEEGGVWVVAPTPVRDTVYWRLLAGAVADEASARELMEGLADRGVKDRVSDWDVRPTPLAYRLADAESRQRAVARAGELRDRGVPAYVLPAPADGERAWQVYSGAYETREAAGRLGALLLEAGVEHELVTRRGGGGDR